MQGKIKELEDALSGFIRQSQRSVLVISLEETELVYALKLVETLDQQDGANVYGLFAQAIGKSGATYADEVLTALHAQLDAANTARVSEGNPSWPPMPDVCSDPRATPTQRLRAAILYARSLVPGGPDHRLVFCLLPQKVESPELWAEVVSSLLPAPTDPPDPAWAGVRVVLRDDKKQPTLIPALRWQKNSRVLVYEPDLSPEAMMDSMARDALDPKLDEPERMQVLGQLAALDYAYDRLDEAAAKYGVLYDYYSRHKAPAMQALVLQGAGDIFRKTGNLRLAHDRYAQGLTHALETQSLPLLLSLTYNVGDTSLSLENWPDAEGHLEIASTLAGKLLNPQLQADAMEKMGIARLAQKRYGEAAAIWNEAAELCRGWNHRDRLISILERLAALYDAGRKPFAQGACETELAAVRSGAPLSRKSAPPTPTASKEGT